MPGIPQRHVVQVTTNTSGAATVFTPNIDGRISAVIYTKDDFADGVDFAITAEDSGQNVWTEADVNAAKSVYPVVAASLPSGAASSLVEVPIILAHERLKIVIANGGSETSGTFTVIAGGG